MAEKQTAPPESGGVARSAGVVPRPKRFCSGTTPRVVFDHAALLTQEGSSLTCQFNHRFEFVNGGTDRLKRTHTCGELSVTSAGQTTTLKGWVDVRRDHGQLVFIDLRDREGITQIVFDATNAPVHDLAKTLRSEFVVEVSGKVRKRADGLANPNLKTGAIEVEAESLTILSEAKTTPFPIADDTTTSEDVRLKYRYLDLRRPRMQETFRMRHRICMTIRSYMDQYGFWEVETPILTKSTPEGARDYLVPSRLSHGGFYALPQSPQLFKQILMISGFEKYFQIVKCFRDEDLRADRQPEFTQVDIEMSFPSQEELFGLIEVMMAEVFALKGITIPTPLPRMSFSEAMHRYGSDKPDTRFDVFLQDFTEIFKTADPCVFREMAESGQTIRGLVAPKVLYSRKVLDDLTNFVKQLGAAGLAWIKTGDDGMTAAPVVKNAGAAAMEAVLKQSGANTGDTVFMMAGEEEAVLNWMGTLRLELARRENWIPAGKWNMLWVWIFPCLNFRLKKIDGCRVIIHSRPPWMKTSTFWRAKPGKVRAKAYDLVLNGTEIGGGSIRIHRSDVQSRIFKTLGFTEAEARDKFGFFLEALEYRDAASRRHRAGLGSHGDDPHRHEFDSRCHRVSENRARRGCDERIAFRGFRATIKRTGNPDSEDLTCRRMCRKFAFFLPISQTASRQVKSSSVRPPSSKNS